MKRKVVIQLEVGVIVVFTIICVLSMLGVVSPLMAPIFLIIFLFILSVLDAF